VRQWRLADGCASATPAGSVANAGTNACSGTAAVRRLHHARSVPGHGRRLLRKWRLAHAAARGNTAGADTGPDARANADTGARTLRRMHDARSVRRARWRHVLSGWMAAAGHADSRRTAAATTAPATTAAARTNPRRLHDARSIRGARWRHVLHGWMAAARHADSRGSAAATAVTAAASKRLHDT